MTNQIETTKYTPKKSKQIALARLDLIHKWLEFRRLVKNKMQADYDFVKLHNTSNSYLFEILGKISRGSLHRWYSMLNGTEDYTKLLPQYKYATVNEYRTTLTDEEIKVIQAKAKLLGEIIDARQELQLTQKKLEAMSGIKQPMIAKIENGNVNPSLDSLLRLLVSMGKTIKVVPI